MQWFQKFQQYRTCLEFGSLMLFLTINAVVMATTQIMDDRSANETASFHLWEPFVWEFSSLAMWLLLVPLITRYVDSPFCSWANIGRTIGLFIVASLFFSALHVTGMMLIRKFVYWSQAMHYQFGDVGYRFFYEYRKDLITFASMIIVIQGYRFIISRLRGEAKIVRDGENHTKLSMFDRILVRKLGKEFIVKVSDIEYLEAAGNYVNLHVQGRIYPTRITLSKLLAEIEQKGFCRVHRSYAVNLDCVASIETHPSGSGDVFLSNGKTLNLSRRYHEELKQRLH